MNSQRIRNEGRLKARGFMYVVISEEVHDLFLSLLALPLFNGICFAFYVALVSFFFSFSLV
jgi:hypothetical protein